MTQLGPYLLDCLAIKLSLFWSLFLMINLHADSYCLLCSLVLWSFGPLDCLVLWTSLKSFIHSFMSNTTLWTVISLYWYIFNQSSTFFAFWLLLLKNYKHVCRKFLHFLIFRSSTSGANTCPGKLSCLLKSDDINFKFIKVLRNSTDIESELHQHR